MTVPVQDPEIAYLGNGVTTSYAFGFKVFAAADLVVRVAGALGVLNVDYTVTGVGLDGGGNVVFAVAPANGARVTIQRSVALSRSVDYQYSGDFQSPTVNRDFDRPWMALQEQRAVTDRSIKLPVGDTASADLPDAATRALRGLAFDASGNLIAAPASDATSLGAALASAVSPSVGGGLVGFSTGNTYAAGTVGERLKVVNQFKSDTADTTDAAKGAALIAYKSALTGAVGRSLAARLDEMISASLFGILPSNTGAQNVTAWNVMVSCVVALGGATVTFARGTYDFNGTIATAGANNIKIDGDGPDATIFRITSATADFLTATGTTLYQTFSNFTLTSSVTRTAGAMFKTGFWKRGLMSRVKISKHFDGINLPQFEQCTITDVNVVDPTGAGFSLIAGTAAASNQGANLNLINFFGRGNDDLNPASAPVGLGGINAYDVEAIFGVNCDIGNYLNQDMVVQPQTRAANFHFVQCYFDGTKLGDCILSQGTGIKQQFRFTGCWWNGAGNMTGGSNDCFGINAIGSGEYYDWVISGGGFISTKGSAFYSTSRYLDFNISGVSFTNCGFGGGTYKHAVHFQPSGASLKSPNINGCKFQGSGSKDIRIETNANGVNVSGNQLGAGISWASGTLLGNCEGNYDPSNAGVGTSIASASSMVIPPTCHYMVVTGTTSINAIQPTYPGHQLSLRFTSALTVVDDGGNLRLVGNYVTTGNSVLTLVCEANGDWREVARATS